MTVKTTTKPRYRYIVTITKELEDFWGADEFWKEGGADVLVDALEGF